MALTFDDGIRSVYTAALPCCATMPPSSPVPDDWRRRQDKSMVRSAGLGFAVQHDALAGGGGAQRCRREVEAHTVNHPDMRTISDGGITALGGRMRRSPSCVARRLNLSPIPTLLPSPGRVAASVRSRYRSRRDNPAGSACGRRTTGSAAAYRHLLIFGRGGR